MKGGFEFLSLETIYKSTINFSTLALWYERNLSIQTTFKKRH